MTLIPHPQYPGYGYYAANPTQLYQLPQPVTLPNPGPSGGGSAGPIPGPTPSPTEPSAPVPVVIVNAGPAGTAIKYVVDGVAYQTESGRHLRLDVGPKSMIRYDRGGDLGEQRYRLSAGVYGFRASDPGWVLFKLRPTPPDDASQSLSVPVPRNELPATTGAPKAGSSGGISLEPLP